MPLFENKVPSKSFTKYIKEQMNISQIELYDSISRRIIIQFTVDSNGYVVDEPLILRGLNETVDSVAFSIVVNSPKWTPGTQRGRNIIVPFTFPIYINMDYPRETTDRKRKKTSKKIELPTTLCIRHSALSQLLQPMTDLNQQNNSKQNLRQATVYTMNAAQTKLLF